VFGSYATGLYLPTSDIDVVVMYWEIDAQTPDVMQKALMTLEKQLINKAAYDDVKVIRTSVSHVMYNVYACLLFNSTLPLFRLFIYLV